MKLEQIPAYLFGLIQASQALSLLNIPGRAIGKSLSVMAKEPCRAFARVQLEKKKICIQR